jgi:NAD(P)-dependent dehydrogenase (short-subunit alcohol dehydrogenase family)
MLRDLSSQINAADPDGVYNRMASQVPLSRLGTAEEVATLVTWLLSDDAAYISGTTQVIDGALNA